MIEFFNHRSNLTREPEMAKIDGNYSPASGILDQATSHKILLILIQNPKAREIVRKLRLDGISNECDIVRRFKACNWDALEALPDIDDNENLNFEYVSCGHKGANQRCPFSRPGDIKPYCIVKNLFNIPEYAKSYSDNRRVG